MKENIDSIAMDTQSSYRRSRVTVTTSTLYGLLVIWFVTVLNAVCVAAALWWKASFSFAWTVGLWLDGVVAGALLLQVLDLTVAMQQALPRKMNGEGE